MLCNNLNAMRFIYGLLVGLLALVSYVGIQQYRRHLDPCLGACGVGTECIEGVCMVMDTKKESSQERGKRRRGRRRRSRVTPINLDSSDQTPLRQPTADDLNVVTSGPSLRQTEVIRMDEDEDEDDSAGNELEESEITSQISKLDRRIAACIVQSRGDVALDQGNVRVGLRVERDGTIQQVRVSAPALLMRGGLYTCIKPLLTGLRFRPSSRAMVMSYPYALQ
jgi:hypothetical protein